MLLNVIVLFYYLVIGIDEREEFANYIQGKEHIEFLEILFIQRVFFVIDQIQIVEEMWDIEKKLFEYIVNLFEDWQKSAKHNFRFSFFKLIIVISSMQIRYFSVDSQGIKEFSE